VVFKRETLNFRGLEVEKLERIVGRRKKGFRRQRRIFYAKIFFKNFFSFMKYFFQFTKFFFFLVRLICNELGKKLFEQIFEKLDFGVKEIYTRREIFHKFLSKIFHTHSYKFTLNSIYKEYSIVYISFTENQ